MDVWFFLTPKHKKLNFSCQPGSGKGKKKRKSAWASEHTAIQLVCEKFVHLLEGREEGAVERVDLVPPGCTAARWRSEADGGGEGVVRGVPPGGEVDLHGAEAHGWRFATKKT